MDVREIARRRMHGQHLWGPPLERLEDVVQWLGALQAQEFAVAKWSVAQRAAGVDAAAMDTAFADGAILPTHLLGQRGTSSCPPTSVGSSRSLHRGCTR